MWRAGPGGAFQRYYAFTYDGPYPQTMREGGPNGNLVVEWDYDALGRTTEKRVLTNAAAPAGTWDTYTWTWDTDWVGARSSVTDPWGSVTYAYDPHFTFGGFGLPTRVERTFTDLATPVAVDRTYDFAGREATVSWPSGAVSAATYGPAGHLLNQDVVWAGSSADVSYLYDAEYGTPSGWVGGQAGAGNETFVVTQDRYGPTRLESIQWARLSGAILREVTYHWSSSGLLNQKEVSPMLEAFFYGYDDLKRITSVTDNARQIERWWYDAIGNPTANADWWGGHYTYGAAPRFHEVGNRTKAGGVVESHTWDATNGRLLARETRVNGSLRDTDAYIYDGAGRLVDLTEQSRPPGGGAMVPIYSTYAYDVDDNLVREDRQEPNGPSSLLYRFEGWREDTVTGLTIESVLPMMSLVDGVPRWTFAEPDGRTLETYASTGASVTFEIVGVYGEALPDFRGVNQIYQQATTWDVGGLHGLEPDRASGLVHAGARHFLMRDGIWLQPEPLLHLGLHNGDLGQPRSYLGTYAGGNTNGAADRGGLYLESAWDIANIAMGVASGISNARSGNYGAAALDAVGVLADSTALALPVVPAGAGTAIRVARMADKVADVVDTASDLKTAGNVAEAAAGASKAAPTVLRDGAGATAADMAASVGGPTGGMRGSAQAAKRAELIDASTAPDGTFSGTCWRCGETTSNPANMHMGHKNVPKSQGGNLTDANVCLEGAACNLSAGNRGAPSPGMSCAERGGCGTPYGRTD